MKNLVINNYDSITYNLAQAIGQMIGVEPVARRIDELRLGRGLIRRPVEMDVAADDLERVTSVF